MARRSVSEQRDRQRRLAASREAEEAAVERCRRQQIPLHINQDGRHWSIRGLPGGHFVDFWPSTGLMVVDAQWHGKTIVADVEEFMCRLEEFVSKVQCASASLEGVELTPEDRWGAMAEVLRYDE